MHDMKAIRENPQAFDAGLARRGLGVAAGALLNVDARRRVAIMSAEQMQSAIKSISEQVGAAMRTGDKVTADQLREQVASLKATQTEAAAAVEECEAELKQLGDALPNLPAPDVPDGKDESGNVEQHRRGEGRASGRDHADFAPALGLDFETAQKVAGARFVYLRGKVARLGRALGQFMLDQAVGAGYEEVSPPLLVRDDAAYGTTQLPKFRDDLFQTTDGRWLIPTAEVSLTNIVREQILGEDELPLRFTALTPCFRSEAGAAGRDTRGLIRQHQFDKVELVSITTPEASDAEHERMTACAESVLEALGLPFRRMLLCAGDMGFAAKKTYDLEVWLPGQGAYREISSCSNCGDFQARRMNARYRAGPKDNRFVHTLNGSALAVGRTIVAVLENYQNEDGSVTVPDVLLPYTGGMTVLTPNG
ncbi:Serine--tRNA ligase [Sphingomonas antarctica]|uniref:serine--tRNA ligase n=1 Tax=Sphingomonas antarctica TaxID=2040274 RepID=UPI0039EC0A15